MNIIKPKFWDGELNLISILLLPLSFIFELYLMLKKKFANPKSFNIPVICVGNIYIGGTGKTPLSLEVAKELSKIGKNPVIIKKFYKNHNDEHALIKKYFKGLILPKNREIGILDAISKGYDTVILDDGFQDFTIKKDLNIICFNQNQLLGNNLIFPAGPLRQKITALKDAHIVIINGKKDLSFEKKILKINKNIDIFYSSYKPKNLDEFKDRKLLAVAGIGNPNNFFNLLNENKLNVEKKISFPDHYNFSKSEIIRIIEEGEKNKLKIIMTEKDFLRIKNLNLDNIKYLKISLEIENRSLLLNKIKKLYD